MFPGSPARLRPRVRLRDVLALARPGAVLGAWLRGCMTPVAIRASHPAGTLQVIAADDLGLLIRACSHVVVRDGERLLAVASGVLVEWRILEVVLAAPYLPTAEQLRSLFPGARVRDNELALPIGLGSAEEALAACAAVRLPVAASRIGYLADKR